MPAGAALGAGAAQGFVRPLPTGVAIGKLRKEIGA